MSERPTPERPVHFGPRDIQSIPFHLITELDQVRSSYNQSALNELKESIKSDPDLDSEPTDVSTDSFELINPVGINLLDQESLTRYIQDHGDHYRLAPEDRYRTDMIPRLPDGRAVILVDGHRRKRAVRLLIDEYALDPEQITISASVEQNASFSDMLYSQLRENIHERPPAQDEARAIDQLYREVTRKTGTPPSIARFASLLPFSETKVRDALAFATLPERIQNFTFDELLSYSIVRRLKPLADAYDRLHAGMDIDARKQAVEDDLVVFCNGMLKMDLAGNVEERRARRIESHVREISGKADYQQESLFFLEQASTAKRREQSHRDVGALAARILASKIQRGELPEDSMDEIAALISEAKSIARAKESTALDIFAD